MKSLANLSKKQRRNLARIITALVLFLIIYPLPLEAWFGESTGLYIEFILFLIPYLIVGYDVLWKALKKYWPWPGI